MTLSIGVCEMSVCVRALKCISAKIAGNEQMMAFVSR